MAQSELEINKSTILSNGQTFEKILHDRKEQAFTSPKPFVEIFGDLSNKIFKESLDLSGLNLRSLKGCPSEVFSGYFGVDNNPNLKSLDYAPSIIDQNDYIHVDSHLFIDMILKYKEFLKSPEVEAFCYIQKSTKEKFEDLILDIISLSKGDFRQESCPWLSSRLNFIDSSLYSSDKSLFDSSIDPVEIYGDSKIIKLYKDGEIEKLYRLFKRLGGSREKLNRALELL